MIDRAASTGLPGCDERVRHAALATDERPRQGRGTPRAASSDHRSGSPPNRNPTRHHSEPAALRHPGPETDRAAPFGRPLHLRVRHGRPLRRLRQRGLHRTALNRRPRAGPGLGRAAPSSNLSRAAVGTADVRGHGADSTCERHGQAGGTGAGGLGGLGGLGAKPDGGEGRLDAPYPPPFDSLENRLVRLRDGGKLCAHRVNDLRRSSGPQKPIRPLRLRLHQFRSSTVRRARAVTHPTSPASPPTPGSPAGKRHPTRAPRGAPPSAGSCSRRP